MPPPSHEGGRMPVSPSMTASQLATFMASTKQKAAAVVDKRNGVIGVVSARDILTRVLAQNKDPSTYNVEKFMTKDPLVVTESEWSKDPDVARRWMTERGFRHIPIVKDTKSREYKNILTLMDETRKWFSKQGGTNFSEELHKVGRSLAKLFGLRDNGNKEDHVDAEKQRSRKILSWQLTQLLPAESAETMLSCHDTLQSAVQFMVSTGSGAVLICRPESPYILSGVISETDIVIRALSQYSTEDQLLERQIEEFWTTGNISSIPASSTLEEALKVMLRNNYRHIPIVDPQTSTPKLMLDIVFMVKCLLGTEHGRSGSFDSSFSEEDAVLEAGNVVSKVDSSSNVSKEAAPSSPHGTPSVSACFAQELSLDPCVFGTLQRIHKRLEDGNNALRQFNFSAAARKFQLTLRLLHAALEDRKTSLDDSSEKLVGFVAILRCLKMKTLSHLSRALFVAEASKDERNVNTIYEAVQHSRDAIQTHDEYVAEIRQAIQQGYRIDTGEEYIAYANSEYSNSEEIPDPVKVTLLPIDAKFLFELDLCDYLAEINEFEEISRVLNTIDVNIFSDKPCKASAATQSQVKKLIVSKIVVLLETAENAQNDVYEEIHNQTCSQLTEGEKDYLLTKAMRAIDSSRSVVNNHQWLLSEECQESASIRRIYDTLQSPQQMHYQRALETAKSLSKTFSNTGVIGTDSIESKHLRQIQMISNDCQRAIELDPGYIEPYLLCCKAHFAAENYIDALETVNRGIGVTKMLQFTEADSSRAKFLTTLQSYAGEIRQKCQASQQKTPLRNVSNVGNPGKGSQGAQAQIAELQQMMHTNTGD